MNSALSINHDQLNELCRRWQVSELAVFGSAINDTFRAESDVDFLVSFLPTANWGLFDHARMRAELETLMCRPVDLVSRKAIERSKNWIRRQSILSTAEPIYVAR